MSVIDLSDIPIIDHHAHALKKVTQPLTMGEYQGYFSESPDPVIKAKYVPDTIIWHWGIRTLANYLNCEASAEAVLAARNALSLQQLANGMWRDQNSDTLLIDYGFRGAENYTPEEQRALFNQKIEMLMRLETFAQELIMQHT